ncbi:pentapeptide repeat-containing protein [Streptomyces sp. NBC_00687]|uniref:pentapeptide repeat-containing protein n=1 Tax=Streptomyces sp. NBC_00687 TaxID=2975807 RepID=UPI002251BD51|nr:pentapeptide repeat-containing protein [Streptomyces sp. NBC_00687]MCX4919906.1 pentapeptide repeat-containing protein [Streptomyces sp. NBC_00687]
MAVRVHRVLETLGGVAVLVALATLVWLPGMVYPPLTSRQLGHVTDHEKRVNLQQAQSQIQNDFRGQLLQAIGGLVVVAGAAAGWQQLRLAREGQITDRFTRAIDHLGSETLDVRLGGIYALERVAKNSPDDRPTVTDILSAFIREHARWAVGAPGGPEHPNATMDLRVPWLTARAPDVQAALFVLGRRQHHPQEYTLYLSRVDLRRALLSGAQMAGTNLRHANLFYAYMPDSNFGGGKMMDVDLRYANLRGVSFQGADLRDAHLEHADLRRATLRGADLRGANLAHANLEGADLAEVQADDRTIWPEARRP